MSVGRLRHLLWPVTAIVVAALAWAAAPALSTGAYMPEAVDFEQPLGKVARLASPDIAQRATGGGEEAVTHVSPVIDAPHNFDLAGLARERREMELRARSDGGAWSRWTETSNGDPVYFGGADELQLRTRGWRPRGTIHYVNVSGTTSTADSLLTGFREAVNSAFITAAAVIEPPAEAIPVRPPIVGRAAWGANRVEGGCRPRETPSRGIVKAAVIHHTVTASKYTEAEAPSIVLGICRYHRNGNGWNDIGYNALVDRFGNLYTGRAGGLQRAVIGAHAQGFNAQTTGIAAIGTHSTTPMTPATLDAIVNYLAWKLSIHAVPGRGKVTMTSAGGSASRYAEGQRVRLQRIVGHRQVGLTACPGTAAFAQLPLIRRVTQERIDAAGGTPAPPPIPEPVPTDPVGGTVPK
jgi:hypothetical protein